MKRVFVLLLICSVITVGCRGKRHHHIHIGGPVHTVPVPVHGPGHSGTAPGQVKKTVPPGHVKKTVPPGHSKAKKVVPPPGHLK